MTKSVTVRLLPEEMERLEALAREADLSRNTVVRWLVRWATAEQLKGAPPLPGPSGKAWKPMNYEAAKRYVKVLREQ